MVTQKEPKRVPRSMPGGRGQEHTMLAPERGGQVHVPGLLPVSGLPEIKATEREEDSVLMGCVDRAYRDCKKLWVGGFPLYGCLEWEYGGK